MIPCRGTMAIARRELIALFGTLVGWAVIALFLMPVGVVFAVVVFRNGQPASLRDVFGAAGWSMLVVAPAITMRGLSEEFRLGTWESLAAAPIGEGAIVLGKFLAAVAMLAAMTAPLAVLALALELHGRPDYGELLCGALGVMLIGALFASVGLWASTVTSSQLVAYLLALFVWLLVALCCLLLPSRSPAWVAELLYASDPLRRLRDLALGLFDTAHLAYALAIIVAVLGSATWCLRARRVGWGRGGGAAPHVALRIMAALLLAGSVIFFAGRPAMRVRVDATRTRAFALSPSTRELLASIDGEWRVTVVLPAAAADNATRRQIDEVLRRLQEANPRVIAARIDPTDPAQLAAWEALVASLQAGTDESTLRAFHVALDDGALAFDELVALAREQSLALAALPPGGDASMDAQVASLRSGFAQLVERSDGFKDALKRLRSTSSEQPVADDEAARSALMANHRHWAEQLDATASTFSRWAAQGGPGEALRRHAGRTRSAVESMAQRLAISQDRLARLPRLEIAEIGRQLGSGEVVVVQGPPGVSVVPSWQLLASGRGDDSSLGVERRFRGEQSIAAAMRSLLRPPPLVIFMHGEERSLVRSTEDRNDLVGAVDVLRQARCDVREWLPSEPSPPAAASGQPTVWIVVPPQTRRGVEIAPGERILLERSRRLFEEGGAMLVTVGRSVRPLFRQDDPWSDLLAPSGMRVETSRVVFEFDRVGPSRGVTRSWQRVEPRPTDHPISAAIAGEGTLFTHPTPVIVAAHDGPARPAIIAEIAPAPTRWTEVDWRSERMHRTAPPVDRLLDAPVAVVAAIERRLPDLADGPSREISGSAADGRRPLQRLVLVGSGGWLLSSVLDEREIVGERDLAANPGNRELLLASVDWLAGRDDEIGQSPAAASTARLAIDGGATRALWGGVAIVGLPLAALCIGTMVMVSRRRA